MNSYLFKHQKTLFALVIILSLNGIYAFFTIPSQENPKVLIREASIVTEYPGMPAIKIEQLITEKLESQLINIPQVKLIRSSSIHGRSTIYVELYDKYFDLNNIWQRIRNTVSQSQSFLPKGTNTSIVNDQLGDVSILNLALSTQGISQKDVIDQVKLIRNYLHEVDGVKKVDIFGVQKELIFLKPNMSALSLYKITPTQLKHQINSHNTLGTAGVIKTSDNSFMINSASEFLSVNDFEHILIVLPNGSRTIPLSSLVSIDRKLKDIGISAAYYNGQAVNMISVVMQDGLNIRAFTPKLLKVIEQIKSKLPVGYQLDIVTNQLEQVNKIIGNVSLNIIQSLAIVLTVSLLFFGWRTGLIVGISIPLVMLITLAIMLWSEIVIERLSLATLVISLGLLVDNSIVIADDFKQKLQQGAPRLKIVSSTIKELAFPLLSSTITTILFFLPLILAEHVASEFTRSISLVIIISLGVSWLLAMTLVPLICFHFMKEVNSTNRKTDKINRGFSTGNKIYFQSVSYLLKHRWKFIIVLMCLVSVSLFLSKKITKQFFPESDRPQILMYLDLPSGSTFKHTDRQLHRLFNFLSDKSHFKNVTNYIAYNGNNGPRFVTTLTPEEPRKNRALIILSVHDMEKMDITISKLYQLIYDEFPIVNPRIKRMFIGTSDSNVLRIQIKGIDNTAVYKNAKAFRDQMKMVDGMLDVVMDWGNTNYVVKLDINNFQLTREGLTHNDITDSLNANYNGEVFSEFVQDEHVIPMMFIGDDQHRFELEQLKSLPIYSAQKNKSIRLEQVANIEFKEQFSIIEKEGLFATANIDLRHASMTAQELKQHLLVAVESLTKSLPIDHHVEYDGVVEDTKSARKALSSNLPFVLICIVILLIYQTKSFRKTTLILLTIPLVIIGAIPGLYLMGGKFGFMVTLGFYSLAGIVINNAIVLIDKIDREMKLENCFEENIINACQSRIRPILLTTFTTSLGLLPLIIYQDPMFHSMAIIMAFGLTIGALLTLFFVPVTYSLMFKR